MPAYLIAEVEVTDPALYETYRAGVPATIAAHGGRYLARGGTTRVLEGERAPKRLVILEFPSMDKLAAWYDSPEYRPLRAMRQRASISSLIATEGL